VWTLGVQFIRTTIFLLGIPSSCNHVLAPSEWCILYHVGLIMLACFLVPVVNSLLAERAEREIWVQDGDRNRQANAASPLITPPDIAPANSPLNGEPVSPQTMRQHQRLSFMLLPQNSWKFCCTALGWESGGEGKWKAMRVIIEKGEIREGMHASSRMCVHMH
jgi:hypothetical protein